LILDTFYFVVCSNLAEELRQVKQLGNIPDIEVIEIPPRCGMPAPSVADIRSLVQSYGVENFGNVCFIGSSCINKDLAVELPGIRIYSLEQCHEPLLNRSLILSYISQGYYILSSGWLRNSKVNIATWKFSADTLLAFFAESAKKLLFLNTGVFAGWENTLKEVAESFGLDYEVLHVGLDYFDNFIGRIVLQWRYDRERKYLEANLSRLTRQSADYSMMFEQLHDLATLTSETEIVKRIMELFSLLFACRSIEYHRNADGQTMETITWKTKTPVSSEQSELHTGVTDELRISIEDAGRNLGEFVLQGFQFPQYKENYRQLLQFLQQVCSLGIANSRKYVAILDNEQLLKQLADELEQKNREKDKLFSVVAHDLRSPLAGFKGLSSILVELAQNSIDPEVKEIAELIDEKSTALLKMMENLMDWSSFHRGTTSFNPVRLALKLVIDRTLQLTSMNAVQKDIRLEVSVDPDMCVIADPKMLQSILQNLLSNAIKFSPRGGNISISAVETELSSIEISVSDSGIGIPTDILEKLFKLGENVSRKGTESEASFGLGLTICQDYLAKHGSKLNIFSQEGIGSRLSFTLTKG
jgi:signal transduction histidine kinase